LGLLVLLLGPEKFVESVELELPRGGAAGEPRLGLLEAGGTGADEMDAAGAAALDEAGAFEDAKMAGNGGRGDAERFGENGDGGFAALAESDQDGAAGRVGESGEDGVHGFGIVNHGVKYSRGAEEVKGYLTGVLSMAEKAKGARERGEKE
jgi:hypothetical protein